MISQYPAWSVFLGAYNDYTHYTDTDVDNCQSSLSPIHKPFSFVNMEPHDTTYAISEPADKQGTLRSI